MASSRAADVLQELTDRVVEIRLQYDYCSGVECLELEVSDGYS